LFFIKDDDILEQAFQQDANLISRLADDIPTNVAPAIEECKRRCHID
jgi:hypothetical protein